VPRALSRQDAFDALEVVEYVSSKPWIAKRDAALMALFYGCGLRLAEALSFKRSDAVAAQRGQLMIMGKGNKQRMVPVLPYVAEALEDYLVIRPFTGDPVFRGSRGGTLHPRIVQDMMRRAGPAKGGEALMLICGQRAPQAIPSRNVGTRSRRTTTCWGVAGERK